MMICLAADEARCLIQETGDDLSSLIVYSSLSGNTRKLADAVARALPSPVSVFPVNSAPDPSNYEMVVVGFWVEHGEPDSASQGYMKRLRRQRVGAFGTMGGDPQSIHGLRVVQRTRQLLRQNRLDVVHLCQGRINVKVIEKLLFTGKTNMDLKVTPEQWARINESRNHPNEQDLNEATQAFSVLHEPLAWTG